MLALVWSEGWWATHYGYVVSLVVVGSAVIGLIGGWLVRRQSFWRWWDKYNAIVVGPLLIAVGLLVGTLSEVAILQELRVALVIAGVLAVTVDPLIKGKAHREAVRDVFHHILGFSLPLPIRNRLLDIVKNTTLYRDNAVMRAALSESGDWLVFDVEMEVRGYQSNAVHGGLPTANGVRNGGTSNLEKCHMLR
jgi:MFS family permease